MQLWDLGKVYKTDETRMHGEWNAQRINFQNLPQITATSMELGFIFYIGSGALELLS